MKNIIRIIFIIAVFVTFGASTLSAQCSGYNVFTGAVDNDWSNSDNWNQNCVPTSPITGRVLIAADCTNSSLTSHIFEVGSTLEIQEGVTFTNMNTSAWTLLGKVVNNGTYIQSELTVDGTYSGNGEIVGEANLNQEVELGYTPCAPLIIDDFDVEGINALGYFSMPLGFAMVMYNYDSTVNIMDFGTGVWYEFLSLGASQCVDLSDYNYLEIKYSLGDPNLNFWVAFTYPRISCASTYDVLESDHVQVYSPIGSIQTVKIPLADFNYPTDKSVSFIFGGFNMPSVITLFHVALTCE